ncbi:ribonuclease E inhibitor RraA/Dimethylmenaquinone methyltransferase [Xylogone sp. PMI_703]|nr:ribonuclease E inhibitor RraA/Dimethylmenaquinone methyltransferase [Xylogone sp. PMI_703]
MAATSEILDALSEFTSCDISDALMKLDVPYGGYLQGISMYSPERETGPAKIFGPAFTVHTVLESDTNAPTPAGHFVDAIPKGAVVYIQQPKNTFNSVWGGLMSTRAKVLGAQGVVIDGYFRDINEHKDLNFPLFAHGFSIVSSNKLTRTSAVNVPLQYSSENQPEPMTINPGDYILADADGVVAIPPALIEQCLKLCQARSEVDKQTRQCLVNGEAFGPTIARLRK